MRRLGLDAARTGEAYERIEHVLMGRGFDLRVREHPLQLASARPIEAELDGRADQAADQAGPKRQLQVQQQIETARAQQRAQPP